MQTNKFENKKIAIVHDWLTVNGGAEKVLEQLLSIFPQAEIVTLIDTLKKSDRAWLGEVKVKTFGHWMLRYFPSKYRFFLPLMPRWIEQIDLSEYDLVISSSHAVAKGVICHPHQIHIAYIYSPMRYAWDLQFEHIDRGDFGAGLKLWFAKRWLHKLRIWDAVSFLRPDLLIATSGFINKRIRQVCNRESPVIYPPVESPDFSLANKKTLERLKDKDYYLIVSRLVPYKSIDKVVKAFQKLPQKKLFIIGDGPIKNELEALAPNNVEFKGFVAESEKLAYLLEAKAFIHMAVEDFGIAPLEAQYAGVPVIGYSRGALSETIQDSAVSDSPTGILFNSQTEEALVDAIQLFESQAVINAENCKENAKRFCNQRFIEQFQEKVLEELNNV